MQTTKTTSKSILLLTVLLITLPKIYGIGIGSFEKYIKFTPNLNKNIKITIYNNVGQPIRVKLTAKGDLAEYVTLKEEYIDIAGVTYKTEFNIKLPESIPPGRNRLVIEARDVTPQEGGGLRAVTAASKAFIIIAPYPGKYLSVDLATKNIGLDEKEEFKLKLKSLGKETIKRVNSVIEISRNNKKIGKLYLEPVLNLEPDEEKTVKAEWDSYGHPVGEYEVNATITYDGKELKKSAKFRIGTLSIKIINYTREAYQEEINKIEVKVKSLWNVEINNVYAIIKIDNENIKTPDYSIKPWQTITLKAFWNAKKTELGEHDITITVFYEDKKEELKGKIKINPKRKKVEAKVIELPSKTPVSTKLLITLVIALIVINISLVVFVIRKNQPKRQLKKNKK